MASEELLFHPGPNGAIRLGIAHAEQGVALTHLVVVEEGLIGLIHTAARQLRGTGAAGAAQQGSSVSLSADGNTALVGGPTDNSGVGAVWIYTRSGGSWTQQGTKLVGTGNTGASQQGSSVALSADGNTALVGGRGDNSNAGAVWVFTRTGTTWTQQGKLVGTGAVGAAYQGWSVALSAALVEVIEQALQRQAPSAQWLTWVEQARLSMPRHRELQYLAGMVCMQHALWGKAQQMLAPLAAQLVSPALQRKAYSALAVLAEQRGDSAAALTMWKHSAQVGQQPP